jgi:hypothetical protein
MHFEILVEDASGELLLSALLPKILGENGDAHTWRTHAYRGIGRVPRDLRGKPDPAGTNRCTDSATIGFAVDGARLCSFHPRRYAGNGMYC